MIPDLNKRKKKKKKPFIWILYKKTALDLGEEKKKPGFEKN